MSRLFSQSPLKKPKRNVFNLSHSVKMSHNMGPLTPILCIEAVPGDMFRGSANALIRLAPMLAPMMHKVNVYTHFFFVPHRIVWDQFEDFITGGPEGNLEPNLPKILFNQNGDNSSALGVGTLADYFGVNISDPGAVLGGPGVPLPVNVLPFRAYQLIFNEYYRDQNLSDPVEFPIDSVNVSYSPNISNSIAERLLTLRDRAWHKDLFTGALPWAQRGAPVTIPITSGTADIVYDTGTTIRTKLVDATGGPSPSPSDSAIRQRDALGAVGDTSLLITNTTGSQNSHGVNIDISGTHHVDFSDGEAGVLVNDFRRSIRLQEWLEKNARGGARYIEQIRSHFGVTSSDARLQRPEFLGGGKSPIMISEVLQTSESATTPQANMAGHGISAHGSHTWSKYIEEHGYIIGIMSVLPNTAYQQGIPRHFLYENKFDFYWPEFAHIGEQEVYNAEIYANVINRTTLKDTFAYNPRYYQYKQMQDRVAGDFKTTNNFWHMGRIFSAPPVFNEQFVTSDPTHRIFNVTDPGIHKLWSLVQHNIKAVRPMPKFGTPTI